MEGRGEERRGAARRGERRGRGWGEKAGALPERRGIEVAFRKEKEEEIQVQEGKYGDKKVGVAGKGVEGTKISPGG